MQIKCNVNQAESIRRGFDADSTVKLAVTIESLSPQQRDVLAETFRDGNYDVYGDDRLQEPTLKGFCESLDRLLRKKTEVETRAKTAEREALERFDANPQDCMYYSAMNGTVLDSLINYATLDAARLAVFNKTAEALKTAYDQRIALEKATAEAVAAERRQVEENKTALVKEWALKFGSETLKLRLEEGFSWKRTAAEEWVDDLFSRAGLQGLELVNASDWIDYAAEVKHADTPSLEEMQLLKQVRTALHDSIEETNAEVKLIDVTYTAHDDATAVIKQTELEVCVSSLGGYTITQYFKI